MPGVRQLPAHRYRMNALLGRAGGRLGDYQRTCDRLWAEARSIQSNLLLRSMPREARVVRTVTVQSGPTRGPFLIDVTLSPDVSQMGLRFEAQRRTLDAAVESAPTFWGAAAGIEVDTEALSGDALESLFVAAIGEVVPPGSLVSPWCSAAELLRRRIPERLGRMENQHRALRAWNMARRGRVVAPEAFLAVQIRAALRGWWTETISGSAGRCRVALIGEWAPRLARLLSGGRFLDVRRAADSGFVYSPATELSPRKDPRDFVPTGAYDPGVLTEPVDALVLLPGAPPVPQSAAEEIGGRLVIETAPGAVLPDADGTLAGRRIDVLPDLLFSAATAIASRALVERRRRSASSTATRIAFELGRLTREVVRDARDRGRSIREQLYLRALGNLQR